MDSNVRLSVLSFAAIALVACGVDRDEQVASAGTGAETGAGDDDAGDGGDQRLDVEGGTGNAGDGGGSGCEKVDFLFVVDNSASMITAQKNLTTSFPGFIAAIQSQVQGQDHHIMVVDSDADPTWVCEPSLHQGDPAWPEELWEYDTCPADDFLGVCVGYPCGANHSVLDVDDKTVGCGVVRPYGGNASNRDCELAGGHRYMTDAQPALEQTFACAATVGSSGHSLEQPVTAMLRAVSPDLVNGGCNAGFLRDDAVLVVVFISDDMDEVQDGPDEVMPGVGGAPDEWVDTLLAAKGGDAGAIVMLGILATPEGTDLDPYCGHGTSDIQGVFAAEKFIEFVEAFGSQGMVADTCAPDYAPFFGAAVELIDTTCDEFQPQG